MDQPEDGADKRLDKPNRPRAPVLDLKAEETPSAPAEATAKAGDMAADPGTADPVIVEAPPSSSEERAAASVEAAAADEPGVATAAGTAEATANASPASAAAVAAPRRRGGIAAALFAGAIAGGAVAAAIALWLPPRVQVPAERVDLISRLQALEAQVTQNAARPPAIPEARLTELANRAVAGEDALLAVRAVEKRLGELETKVAAAMQTPPPSPPPAVDDAAVKALAARVAPLEAAGQKSEADLKALQSGLAEARKRLEEIAAAATAAQTSAQRAASDAASSAAGVTGEIGKLAARLQAVEAALAPMQQKLAAPAAPDRDEVARLATAAQALRRAAERGEPFASELATATALKGDSALLAALQPFATSGVPSVQALAGELDTALAKGQPSAPAASGGNLLLDRLQASASKLVQIRRTDEAPAAGSAGAGERLRAAMRRGDAAGVQAEAAKLSPAEAAAAQPSLAKLQARAAALDAARKLAQQTAERLAAKAAQ